MEHECADCGSDNVEEVEIIDEFPPAAVVFKTKNSGSGLDTGTIVEAVGFGLSDREDIEPGSDDEKRFYIRAQAVLPDPERPDTLSWWYFTSRDLKPLTPAARAWLKWLERAERKVDL